MIINPLKSKQKEESLTIQEAFCSPQPIIKIQFTEEKGYIYSNKTLLAEFGLKNRDENSIIEYLANMLKYLNIFKLDELDGIEVDVKKVNQTIETTPGFIFIESKVTDIKSIKSL